MGQSNQYTELKAVTGNVGKDVSAGVNKQIIWQPLQEQMEFVAQNVRFKVEAKPYYYFSVSATKKVAFSRGNLQYSQSTNTWSFAEHQYDMLGTDNVAGGTESYDTIYGYSKSGSALADKIDLFGWSGSTGSVRWGISPAQSYSDYSGVFVDWGTNIGDGSIWYTLTIDEWYYLLYTRTNAYNLKGVARINFSTHSSKYINGLILLPDNWICPAGITFKSGFAEGWGVQRYANYQTFSLSDWRQLEAVGAVFLPASGGRRGSEVFGIQDSGCYWSATSDDSNYAWEFYFDAFDLQGYGGRERFCARSPSC